MIFLLFMMLDEFHLYLSGTSLNEPEELNHWAAELFLT